MRDDAVAYDEFRVLVQPDLANPGQWSVHVQKCPLPMLVGARGTVAPQVTPDDLKWLRNPGAPPDLAALKKLGKAVLDSIMPPTVQFGLQVCVDGAVTAKKGLHVVVSMLGNAHPPAGIAGNELPVEAAFSPQLSFIATNVLTPVSRGVAAEADRDAVKLAPPLRLLVVASEPTDMPPVHAAQEKAALAAALQPLVAAGAVRIDYCEPPTRAELNARVQQDRPHVVHFIGHGDFDVVGPDPSPQPHLYFEDGTPARERQPADAEQLYGIVGNGNVPLVVLTACSSAAASPNGADYPALAFEGLAEALVQRPLGPLAAVAMQFDLESAAAPVFTGSFYRDLLRPERTVDQAVSVARTALQNAFGAAHRSWVNPTVYWRCRDGRVFDVVSTGGDLTAEELRRLAEIDAQLATLERILKDLAKQPPEIAAATAPLRAQWQADMDGLLDERGAILGETVRLRGGRVDASQDVECALTVQLRAGATIGDVKATLGHDPADFSVLAVAPGKDVAPGGVFQGGGGTEVLVPGASRGVQWAAGEYELAKIRFHVANPGASPVLRIPLAAATVAKNGGPAAPWRPLHAVVFGT